MFPGAAEYAMCAFGGVFSISCIIAAAVLALHNSERSIMNKLAQVFTPHVRQRLYFAVLALLPILVTYGVLQSDDVALWAALAAAVFGIGTASVAVTQQRNDGTLP